MLKEGKGDAFVSAGSTGALHVGASLIVRTLKGIKRPALATMVPAKKQAYLLLDCGANVECRPEMLAAFAVMGSCYVNKVEGRRSPSVALANNGAEESKGTPMLKEAHQLLKTIPGIRFVGNIEASYIFTGKVADVIVCDGFVGNTVLKMAEGLYRINKALGVDNPFWNSMNYEMVGGTPVLGVNAPVIIGHGCSTPLAIKNMILSTVRCAEADLTGKLKSAFNN